MQNTKQTASEITKQETKAYYKETPVTRASHVRHSTWKQKMSRASTRLDRAGLCRNKAGKVRTRRPSGTKKFWRKQRHLFGG